MTSSKNKITFETNCETNEYFHLFINTEMLVIAARTHVDYVECTSMVFHSSVKSCKNVETREMDCMFSATSLEIQPIVEARRHECETRELLNLE